MTTQTKQNGLSPLSGWRTRLHTITCPSGQRLRIRIPGVETILEHGDLPEALVDIALLEITREDGAAGAIAEELPTLDAEKKLARLAEFGAFQRALAAAAVMEIADGDTWQTVTLTADELREMPDQDVEMVAMIVLRLRATDARGVTIGVDPLARWDTFRELHSCPDGCESCEAVIATFSTADVGAM